MTIRLNCAECRRKLKVPDEALGKKVQCPVCGARFLGRIEPDAPATPMAKGDVSPQTEAATIPNLDLDDPATKEPIADDMVILDEPPMEVSEAVEEPNADEVAEELEPEIVEEDEETPKKKEPKKKSRKMLWGCLSAVALVLLIGCGGGGFFAYRFWTGYISEDDWKTFAPPGGFCSISMPGEPVSKVDSSQPFQMFRFTVEKPLARSEFLLLYYDAPLGGVQTEPLLDAMIKEESSNIANKFHAVADAPQSIRLRQYTGKEVRLHIGGGRNAIIRFFVVPQGKQMRVYELVASGPGLEPTQEAGAKFFNSFLIVPPPPSRPAPGGPPRPQPQPRPRPQPQPKSGGKKVP
jgi:DNA-directed RNA polymerase subunit RPC12/RpoP